MSDVALEAEVARLRDQVARLEAARPADMEGFRQLNDAIVDNRLAGFIAEKSQPRWLRVALPAFVLIVFVLMIVLLSGR